MMSATKNGTSAAIEVILNGNVTFNQSDPSSHGTMLNCSDSDCSWHGIDLKRDAGWPFLIIYTILLILATMAGNIGNVMVVGAVLVDRKLRKSGNLFIVNLAVADLCVTGFVDPFSVIGVFIDHRWFLEQYILCHVIGSVCLISCVCSLWSIAAISVNRYILLCKPGLYNRIFTWRRSGMMVAGLWVGAALLDLPNFLDWGNHTYDMKTMACSYDRLASYSYTVFFIMMFVTVPLFTVLFCNINIYIVVVRSKIRVASHGNQQSGQSNSKTQQSNQDSADYGDDGESYTDTTTQQTNLENSGMDTLKVPTATNGSIKKNKRRSNNKKNDVKLAKTLFIIFIVFCVCWTPYALLCLIDKHDVVMLEAYALSILLAHASSTLNSILYAVTNKSFRDGYIKFLEKCGCHCFSDK